MPPNSTSRCLAHEEAAARKANVLLSRWMIVLPRRSRTIAVYRVAPFACFRALIVAIPHLEETRYSCLLYVSSATHKLPAIRRNPAETHRMENAGKKGISLEKQRVLIDRRLSVAPMMEWTD